MKWEAIGAVHSSKTFLRKVSLLSSSKLLSVSFPFMGSLSIGLVNALLFYLNYIAFSKPTLFFVTDEPSNCLQLVATYSFLSFPILIGWYFFFFEYLTKLLRLFLHYRHSFIVFFCLILVYLESVINLVY